MGVKKADMRKLVEREGASESLHAALWGALDSLHRTESVLDDDSVYRETLRARGIISALIDSLDLERGEYYERNQKENEHIRAVLGKA